MVELTSLFSIMTTRDDGFWGYSVFNNESNDEDDERVTLYNKDGVKLLACHDWGYFELLGLEHEEYVRVKETYKSYVKLRKGLVRKLRKGLAEEFKMEDKFDEGDEDWEDIDEGYASNNPCDTYGMCGGTSCPQYWKCHSK